MQRFEVVLGLYQAEKTSYPCDINQLWRTCNPSIAVEEAINRGVPRKIAMTEILSAISEVRNGKFSDETDYTVFKMKGSKGLLNCMVIKETN